MSSLVRRSSSNLTQQQHVDRIAHRTTAAGIAGIAFVVTFVLMIIGLIGASLPFLAFGLTAGFGYSAYRALEAGKNPHKPQRRLGI